MIAIYDKSLMEMCARKGCPRRLSNKKLLSILILAVLAGILAGCGNSGAAGPESAEKGGGGGGKGGGRRAGGGGDVPVTVALAATKDVPVEVQVIGNVEAYSTISVRAQVTGQITEVFFKEGDFVKKDDQLFTIDPRPLQAALNQMQANLSKDEAVLGQAEANQKKDEAQARFVESQAQRYAQLFDQKIVSKDQAEQFRANADAIAQTVQADKATIESVKASIGASRAAMENARVQLGFTTIRSPITGRTGNLTVKQGNIATANSQELVTIVQVEPIYVTFAVPEAQLTAVKKYMAVGKLPVRVRQQDDSSIEEVGTLTFVDNSVDMTTGTIKLKGTFPNADHKLWPGQFVRVNLRLTTRKDAVVVPNESVQTGQNGSFIYVVKPDRTVESRPVMVGARVDQDMVIESGIQPGDTVVTEGQLRLAPGSRVMVRDGRGGGRGRGAAEGGGGRGGEGGREGRGGEGGDKQGGGRDSGGREGGGGKTERGRGEKTKS
jgi:multidrug efflux system membrane fusion protein